MIKLNGVEWFIKFVSPNDLILMRKDGILTLGMCDSATKMIYINGSLRGYMLRKVLCHELVHAALFSYDIHSLTIDQEELICDIIATYGDEIIDKTNLIFGKLRESY